MTVPSSGTFAEKKNGQKVKKRDCVVTVGKNNFHRDKNKR